MYARGVMIGLSRGINKFHVCRAVLESITYQMTDLLEAMMKDSDIILKDLRVDGGASVSDIMMQMQADMTGVNVNRPKNVETTALPTVPGWLPVCGKTRRRSRPTAK